MGLRARCNLCDCAVDAGIRLHKDLDHSDAIERLRFDVLDIVNDSGEVSFRYADDAVAHLFGDETVVAPDDADNRDVNIRKNVTGRT